MKLIDKDAVVTEIDKRLHQLTDAAFDSMIGRNLIEIKDFLDTLEVKEMPIWEKVSPDTGQTTLYKDEDKSYLERFGYRIDLNELDKLPKKNLKAQEGE